MYNNVIKCNFWGDKSAQRKNIATTHTIMKYFTRSLL